MRSQAQEDLNILPEMTTTRVEAISMRNLEKNSTCQWSKTSKENSHQGINHLKETIKETDLIEREATIDQDLLTQTINLKINQSLIIKTRIIIDHKEIKGLIEMTNSIINHLITLIIKEITQEEMKATMVLTTIKILSMRTSKREIKLLLSNLK